MLVLWLRLWLWWIMLGQGILGEKRVVSAGEGFGEAEPVAVVVMIGVDVGGPVIEVDEFGFAVEAEDLDASCQRLVS